MVRLRLVETNVIAPPLLEEKHPATPATPPVSIPFSNMYFGTPRKSQCGICATPTRGYWKSGVLQEDIICIPCKQAGWKFDDDGENYVRLAPRPRCTTCDSVMIEDDIDGGPFCGSCHWFVRAGGRLIQPPQ